MIKFANQNTEIEVRQMWKTCFGDSDEFINLFFGAKYKHENTLVYFVDGEAVASLQMLPYTITFYGEEIQFYYLAGLCTLPLHRKKGYMQELILESFKIMQKRNIPLSILIPAEEWLFDFYRKYGFEKVFDRSEDAIPLNEILRNNPNDLCAAYQQFDSLFRSQDFCVQKTFNDFETIVEEHINAEYPEKHNLTGMARIIDADFLLNIYAKQNADKSFIVKIFDPIIKENNQIFMLQDGEEEIDAEINILTRLLFGHQMHEFKPKFRALFQEHQPIINLMLE